MLLIFKCPNCGNRVVADECKFCSKCGAPMEQVGTELDTSVPMQAKKSSAIRYISISAITISSIIICICLYGIFTKKEPAQIASPYISSTQDKETKTEVKNENPPAGKMPNPDRDPEPEKEDYSWVEVPIWYEGTAEEYVAAYGVPNYDEEYGGYTLADLPDWYTGNSVKEYVDEYGWPKADEYYSDDNWSDEASEYTGESIWFDPEHPFGYFIGRYNYYDVESALSLLYDAETDRLVIQMYDTDDALYAYETGIFLNPKLTAYADSTAIKPNTDILFQVEGESTTFTLKVVPITSLLGNNPDEGKGDHLEGEVNFAEDTKEGHLLNCLYFNNFVNVIIDWDSVNNYPY